jgi:hypothetical protein
MRINLLTRGSWSLSRVRRQTGFSLHVIICTPSLFLLLLLFLLTLLFLLFYHHHHTFAPPGEIIVLIASSETGWAKGNALPYPLNSLPSLLLHSTGTSFSPVSTTGKLRGRQGIFPMNYTHPTTLPPDTRDLLSQKEVSDPFYHPFPPIIIAIVVITIITIITTTTTIILTQSLSLQVTMLTEQLTSGASFCNTFQLLLI